MKKSLIALALVAGFAQANETTLYGRVVSEVQYTKPANVKGAADVVGYARFGIKGNEDLNAGLKAIYQMEFNYNFNSYDSKTKTYNAVNAGRLSEVRQGYVGLQGNFGTIKLGKQSSVHSLFTGKADYSNAFGGKWNDGTTRLANAISYASPDFSGVTVAAAAVLEGKNTTRIVDGSDSRSATAFEVGAQYAANGLEVAATYTQADKVSGSDKFYAASAAYNADVFGVAFDYERHFNKDNYFALAGQYKFTEQDRVYAGVKMISPKAGEDNYFGHLGYEHKLSKRTKTWVEVGGERAKLSGFTKTKNGFVASVGLRHDF